MEQPNTEPQQTTPLMLMIAPEFQDNDLVHLVIREEIEEINRMFRLWNPHGVVELVDFHRLQEQQGAGA